MESNKWMMVNRTSLVLANAKCETTASSWVALANKCPILTLMALNSFCFPLEMFAGYLVKGLFKKNCFVEIKGCCVLKRWCKPMQITDLLAWIFNGSSVSHPNSNLANIFKWSSLQPNLWLHSDINVSLNYSVIFEVNLQCIFKENPIFPPKYKIYVCADSVLSNNMWIGFHEIYRCCWETVN